MSFWSLIGAVGGLIAPITDNMPIGSPRWGDDGHRIVCDIAWQFLTPRTRRAIQDFLPDGEYQQLTAACTWADRYARTRRQYTWLNPYHYVNVPIDAPAYRRSQHCADDVCVVEAVTRFTNEMADESLPAWRRINAMRLLGHFVGDLHNPLHLAHTDDCGGCSAKPTLDGTSHRNMHTIWDRSLIDKHLERTYEREANDDIPYGRWEDYAWDLRLGIDASLYAEWTRSLDPADWANESLAIAQSDLFAYTTGDTIPDEYLDEAMPIIAVRLQQAGVRLAAVLNGVFDD